MKGVRATLLKKVGPLSYLFYLHLLAFVGLYSFEGVIYAVAGATAGVVLM